MFIFNSGAGAGGDAVLRWFAGSSNWVAGVDNSDSSSWVLAPSTALGTSNALKVTTSGVVSIPGLTASRGIITDASKNLISADAPLTNSLGADVTLNNIANYFDGPSAANGTTGTFFVSGTVTLSATAATSVYLKLWDGTTVIASCSVAVGSGSSTTCASLSGYLTTPAGNLRISARDPARTDTKILFNATGNSKDSTISAIRVA
jgi:hypothetical protein